MGSIKPKTLYHILTHFIKELSLIRVPVIVGYIFIPNGQKKIKDLVSPFLDKGLYGLLLFIIHLSFPLRL